MRPFENGLRRSLAHLVMFVRVWDIRFKGRKPAGWSDCHKDKLPQNTSTRRPCAPDPWWVLLGQVRLYRFPHSSSWVSQVSSWSLSSCKIGLD